MLVAPINSAITNNYNLKICQNAKQRKKKRIQIFLIPIASIIDWKPKIIIATPPNISI